MGDYRMFTFAFRFSRFALTALASVGFKLAVN
jgi:hypothetical protein